MKSDENSYNDLSAIFVNCTLKKSPAKSNTDGLVEASRKLMNKQGVKTEVIRLVDHEVPPGMSPDMSEQGWNKDEWPKIFKKVMSADILIVAGPIWLGDNSSETKKLIERLYSNSGETNDKGQYIYYGKVGGAIITGNEDGGKHCSMNILYSLQHIGFTIPPQADTYWVGEAGPGPSYMDKGSGGPENNFTNRSTAFMTWNLLHLARLLKNSGGIPAFGNQSSEWKAGTRFDYENPEYQ